MYPRASLFASGTLAITLGWAAAQPPAKPIQPPAGVGGKNTVPEAVSKDTDDKDLSPSRGGKDNYTSTVGGRGLNEWMTDLKNQDPSVRERAIRAVVMFGPLASPAIPTIIDRTSDRDSSPRIRAVMALGMMDFPDRDIPKVVEALVRRISSENQSVIRYQAMISLSRFQAIDAKTAIPPLAKEVDDQTTWEMRKLAVTLLTRLAYDEAKGPDALALRALITALKDPAIQVRQEAVYGLATIGRPADPALAASVKSAMSTLTTNPDKGIAIWAHVGLINLDKVDGKLLSPIIKHLSDTRMEVRVLATRALGTLGKLAEFALPDLVRTLADPEPEVQMMGIWALTTMGKNALKAVPNLEELSKNKKALEMVRLTASTAVGQITGKPEGTLLPKTGTATTEPKDPGNKPGTKNP